MEKKEIFDLIAENLRNIMNDKGIAAKELSRRCDISPGMISKILNGTTGVTINTAMELATGLDVGLEDILKGLNYQSQLKKKSTSETPEEKIFIGILSINNKRITCIKDATGKTIGRSELEGGLDLVESSSSLLKLINESIRESLHKNEKPLERLKSADLNLVTQSYEFEETKAKFLQFAKKHFKNVRILSDWQLTYMSTFKSDPGISLIADKGISLSYKIQNEIKKIGGWKFPVYDLGGENWLGAEVVRHTIEAAEGITNMSGLAHNILAKFSGRPNSLAEFCLMGSKDADIFCFFTEPLLRMYFTDDLAARKIIESGAQHIKNLIARADEITGGDRKIVFNGSLVDIYKPFLDSGRLVEAKSDMEKANLLSDLNH